MTNNGIVECREIWLWCTVVRRMNHRAEGLIQRTKKDAKIPKILFHSLISQTRTKGKMKVTNKNIFHCHNYFIYIYIINSKKGTAGDLKTERYRSGRNVLLQGGIHKKEIGRYQDHGYSQ